MASTTEEKTQDAGEATEVKAPRIKSENPDFAEQTLPTLRSWLRYWEGVKAGTRKLTEGSKDTVEMAPDEIAKLSKEIAYREANRSSAGPNGK